MNKLAPGLSIIGAGKLGQSLARLWHDKKILSIRQICNRSINSAEQAIDFIGAGHAENQIKKIKPCDFVLIATPDTQIEIVCADLAQKHGWLNQSVVFHCSGALSSLTLRAAGSQGAKIASVHPVKSFVEPAVAITSFVGTVCGVEGDDIALEKLEPLFTELGAKILQITAESKTLYHSAAVFANNYLVTLIDVAQQVYAKAGLNRDQSMSLLTPMLRETTENLVSLGTEKSLTGPIARGDIETVKKHLEALASNNVDIQELYKLLGLLASKLKDRSGTDPIQMEIRDLFQ